LYSTKTAIGKLCPGARNESTQDLMVNGTNIVPKIEVY